MLVCRSYKGLGNFTPFKPEAMVLLVGGNAEHAARAKTKNFFSVLDFYRRPYTDQINGDCSLIAHLFLAYHLI